MATLQMSAQFAVIPSPALQISCEALIPQRFKLPFQLLKIPSINSTNCSSVIGNDAAVRCPRSCGW
jgi:hypothetical protein